jgi:toxin-antitoxin system PIN domain toxin
MILVDTNLLIYAVDADAPQHRAAHAWVMETFSSDVPVVLPWVVLTGFIRLTTNPLAMRTPMPVNTALAYVSLFLQQPNVSTLNPGDKHWLILSRLLGDNGTAGNLTTDAHIAAIAIEHGCTVYSADNDFKRFVGLQHINPLAHRDIHETLAQYS